MSSPSFPEPPAAVPPTPLDEIDRRVARVAKRKDDWLQVGLIEPMNPPIDGTNRTFFYPRSTGNLEYEVRSATAWVRGSGVPEIELMLTPSSSFLSVRIENGLLVGGVRLIASHGREGYTARLAGPFLDDTGGAMVLEAADEAEAKAVVAADPAVIGQVMVAEVHPWRLVEWEKHVKK